LEITEPERLTQRRTYDRSDFARLVTLLGVVLLEYGECVLYLPGVTVNRTHEAYRG